MEISKIYKIIDQLLKKTEARELKWDSSGVDDEFQVSLLSSIIIVGKGEDSSGTIYYLRIYNLKGDKIFHNSFSMGEQFHKLGSLFREITEYYFKADDTINNTLDELNDELI